MSYTITVKESEEDMKVGLIGLGSMGMMFVNKFIQSGAVEAKNLVVSTRTKSKLIALKEKYPDIQIVDGNQDVARLVDCIVICVKPLILRDILLEIKPLLKANHHIVSTAAMVKVAEMEKLVSCKITIFMPTVTLETNEGVSLICHNNKIVEADKQWIQHLFRDCGTLKTIDEKVMGFMAELTSCGPGFYATMLAELAKAAGLHTKSVDEQLIQFLIHESFLGTLKLMKEKKLTPDDIVQRVATKGGITEAGLAPLREGLPRVFNEMFTESLNKRKSIENQILQMFE